MDCFAQISGLILLYKKGRVKYGDRMDETTEPLEKEDELGKFPLPPDEAMA